SLVTAGSSPPPILCNGGSSPVTVTASCPTRRSSDLGDHSVSAGTYSFTVTDANSCTATTSGNITEPSLVTAGSSHTPILCNGGSSTVTEAAGGGTPPYTSAGDHSVSAGTYSFTVTDA